MEDRQTASMDYSVAAVAARMEAGFFVTGSDIGTSLATRAYLHHFQATGSHSRAQLALATSTSLDLPETDGEWIAAAVELLHNASLLQDDFQDKSPSRRGRAAVWLEFGADVALGLTDRLITAACVCLSHVSSPLLFPPLIARMHAAVAETIDGQTTNLAEDFPPSTLERKILLAAAKKSGPLFALAIELPLIAASREEFVPVAHDAAVQFGLGYQICDDLRDIVQDRPSATNANLILVLETRMGTAEAREWGVCLAADCFARSIELSQYLPGRSGTALRNLAERASTQLGS